MEISTSNPTEPSLLTAMAEDLPSPSSISLMEDSSSPPQVNFFDQLSDEICIHILFKYFSADPKTLANLSGVNRRFRGMVLTDDFVNSILEQQVDPTHRNLFAADAGCSHYEKIAFYQAVVEQGLFRDNRIGFDFASTDIDNNLGSASQIPGSRHRIHGVGAILEQFDHSNCSIEAHCGTSAPPGIAPDFSRLRGEVVESEIRHSDYAIRNVAERFTMNPWGRRVAQRATTSDHEYGQIARQGYGWVELYLTMGEMELPQRPTYYEGVPLNGHEEQPIMFRILW